MKNNETLYSFLKSLGFERIKEGTSTFFGDYYDVFANENFQLRISSSRSFETMDIRSSKPSENWYDLALLKAHLFNEKNLTNVTTIEEHRCFLQNELSNITELFNDLNYITTKRRLEELGNKRAKQMFPEIGK